MHSSLVTALALALALPAPSADTAAEARAGAIAPFLDEQTVAVARLDLARVDGDALATALADLGAVDADEGKDIRAGAGRWLGALTKAGARDLYFVFSLADYPNIPFVIVPLREGADAGAVAALLDFPGVPSGPREKVGGAVFAGTAAARDRLRTLKPAARPDVARAFAAAGDGAAQMALVPPTDLARIVEETLPVLPKELGGGPGTTLTHGVRWAALGLDAPPKTALRLTIQSADARAAAALKEAFDRGLEELAREKGLLAVLPDVDKMTGLVRFQVEGDRVVLSLQGREAGAVLAPLVRLGTRWGARARSTANLQRLAFAVHSFVDANRRAMPAVANFTRDGKPLLSWRVHVLPFLGEEKLYKEFHLDEPWDSEHNKKLLDRMPEVYRGPSRRLTEQGKTVYLAPVGKDLAFSGGPAGRTFPQDFPDGTSNTILLVEADDAHAVEWTKPADLEVDRRRPDAGLARVLGDFLVALADGSARRVKTTVSKETLWAAFTRDGGEVLGPDW
jgi:hypothetical protein